jgi:hypothetical protein
MSNNYKQCLVGAVVVFGLALGQLIDGGLTPPVWAGQAEQFTPEFKEVRKSFDATHPENRCSGYGHGGVNGSMSRSLSGAEESTRH